MFKIVKIDKTIHRYLKLSADYMGIGLYHLINQILGNWLKKESKFKDEYLKEVQDEKN